MGLAQCPDIAPSTFKKVPLALNRLVAAGSDEIPPDSHNRDLQAMNLKLNTMFLIAILSSLQWGHRQQYKLDKNFKGVEKKCFPE